MTDWIGLGIILVILAGGLFGLSHLGAPPKQISTEEFEKRVRESQGWMTAGVAGGMYALQKLMHPKAAEAIEVQKDLRAGFYDDQQETGGEGSETDSEEIILKSRNEEEGDA